MKWRKKASPSSPSGPGLAAVLSPLCYESVSFVAERAFQADVNTYPDFPHNLQFADAICCVGFFTLFFENWLLFS